MVTRSVEVTNALGLHARAAARFVHLATRFNSQIRVSRDTVGRNGKPDDLRALDGDERGPGRDT